MITNVLRLACISGLVMAATMAANIANAGDPAALEKLDKQWGSTTDEAVVKGLLADKIMTISPDGMADKATMVAADMADIDAGTPYTSSNYKTEFLSDDIAVMVHEAEGDEPHMSMHVWQKLDGKWQVVASATVPTEQK